MVHKRSSLSEDDDSAEDGSEQIKPDSKRSKTILSKAPRDFDENVRSVEDLKDDFIAGIDSHLKGSTVFAVYDEKVHCLLPRLPLTKVPNIGVVPTPVTGRFFKDLLSSNYSDSSPVDKLKNYVSLDSSNIELLNKTFIDDMKTLVNQDIIHKLGISSNIKVDAKLHKLFVGGTGCKPCLLSETMPTDAFGFVVVMLPSIYETSFNGNIKVTYKSQSAKFAVNKDNVASSCSYIALFSGCLLDFGEITDGHLTCLVYHICQNEVGVTPAPFDEAQSITTISNLLESFMFSVDIPLLAWALQGHKYYDQNSYGWTSGDYTYNKCSESFVSNEDWLKDPDSRVLSLIRKVLAHDKEIQGKRRYHLYLSIAELTIHRKEEEDDECDSNCYYCDNYNCRQHPTKYEEIERSLSFKKFLPLTASTVKTNENFDMDCTEPINQMINFSMDKVISSLWSNSRRTYRCNLSNLYYSRFSLVFMRADCAVETKFKSSPKEGLFHLIEIAQQEDSLEEARNGLQIVLPEGEGMDKAFDNANVLIDIVHICGILKEKQKFLEVLSKLEKHDLTKADGFALKLADAMNYLGNSDCVSKAFIKFIKSREPSDYSKIIKCYELNCSILKPVQLTDVLLNLLLTKIDKWKNESSEYVKQALIKFINSCERLRDHDRYMIMKNPEDLDHLCPFAFRYVPEIMIFMINAKTATNQNMHLLSRCLIHHHPFNMLIKLAIEKNCPGAYTHLLTQIKTVHVVKEATEKENYKDIIPNVKLLQSNGKLTDCLEYLDALLPFMVRATDLFNLWKGYLSSNSPEKSVLEKLGRRMSELMIEGNVPEMCE